MPDSLLTSVSIPQNAAAQQAVIAWFNANGRDLPWRATRDPYRILVSEVMLQQTQVDRVLPLYRQFLERFPSAEALAAAPTADVIRMWAGLGYNRRAVNLQRAAQTVMQAHGGQFPRTVEGLLSLPGVGPYTAGAVACFAFELDSVFLDTNIRRVLRRWLFGTDEQLAELSDNTVLEAGQQILPSGQGWTWNQAIMEIGALICTARQPRCPSCPLQTHCRAYHDWRMEQAQQTPTQLSLLDDEPVSIAPLAYTPTIARTKRRVAETTESFVGSRRWWRGRIVATLRDLHESTEPTKLGTLIKADFDDESLPWLRELLDGLARDGLVAWDGEAVRLP